MVRKRGRNARAKPRRSTNMQNHLRQLQRAVNNVVTTGTPGPDPPKLKLSKVHSTILQFHLGVSGTRQKSWNAFGDAIYTESLSNKPLVVFKVNYGDICNLFAKQFGFAYDKAAFLNTFLVAINKICVWGPVPSLGTASITVHVDDSDRHQTATDAGAANVRPRISLNLPLTKWINGVAYADIDCIYVEITSAAATIFATSNLLATVQISMSLVRDFGSRDN